VSLRDYELSQKLEGEADWVEDFYGLIMVAMRNADTENQEKLKAAWPEVYEELQQRYNAPRGLLPGERDAQGWRRDSSGSLLDPEGKLVRAI
jgi:hypothetical protein